jgi:hypothetical protein
MRWRRLFALEPSRPGHPFGLHDLFAGLLAYAITLGALGALCSNMGVEKPWAGAAGLFVLFAAFLIVRYRLERRGRR